MWALILAASLGPGSEITHDCGYWTRPDGQAGRKWVALPKRLVLVGIEDKEEAKSLGRKPMYVFGECGHPWPRRDVRTGPADGCVAGKCITSKNPPLPDSP